VREPALALVSGRRSLPPGLTLPGGGMPNSRRKAVANGTRISFGGKIIELFSGTPLTSHSRRS
jgi:hypothetical protein